MNQHVQAGLAAVGAGGFRLRSEPSDTESAPKEVEHALDPPDFYNFDHLPDEARVTAQTVAALYRVSVATVWRWSKAGLIVSPRRCRGSTRWLVGDLRRATREAA